MYEAQGCAPLRFLPLPMKSIGLHYRCTADDIARHVHESLRIERSWGVGCRGDEITTEFAIAQLGPLEIATGRTRPVFLEYSISDRLTVALCYAGQSLYREGSHCLAAQGGEMLVFPNAGGILQMGTQSGTSFSLDTVRLARTARAMHLDDVLPLLQQPKVLGRSCNGGRGEGSALMFSLLSHIDQVFQEGFCGIERLELDDQVYRTFIVGCGFDQGKSDMGASRSRHTMQSGSIDHLVDFIRSAIGERITLTDLEEQSHYSARHLQNLFRAKFDCTPMQFVRRQRLSSAMEQLKQADCDQTITNIARACGYRFTANFSNDFQREYGMPPSTVLRGSRKPSSRDQFADHVDGGLVSRQRTAAPRVV